MDPFSEQGLAAPSLYHGCSTDSKSDWTEVGKKKNSTGNDKITSTDNLDAPDDDTTENSEPKKMEGTGSPPTTTVRIHLDAFMTMKTVTNASTSVC